MDTTFSLAHIGSLLSERNPTILWESLSELLHEIPDFKSHFELKLMGALSQEVLQSIADYQLGAYTTNLGYVSHQVALEQQRKSQILLLIEIDSKDTQSIIPGKLFEYMVSERPILALGPEGSDFAEIVKETNTGSFFLYHQKEALKAQILAYYQLFLAQNLKVYPVGLQQYARKNLTQQLAQLVSK